METIQSRDKDKAGWDSSILDYFLPGSSSFTPLQVERVKEQPAGGGGSLWSLPELGFCWKHGLRVHNYSLCSCAPLHEPWG